MKKLNGRQKGLPVEVAYSSIGPDADSRRVYGPGRAFRMEPNALAAKPTGDSTLCPPTVDVDIEDALDQAGVINYASEGLAEAIAIRAIQEAIRAGLSLEPPVHEQPDPDNPGRNHLPTGRERFRSQFFETIVVGEGVCRVLLRVR